ncbi:MAG: phenylacetate--CoA ligase family protein [Verrucomicrobiaceae bacterium]|nr:phenylacetate--CoA ligase family protein [Verrucomicrobiaceae bacterium]
MSLEDTLYPLLRLYEAAPQPVKTLAGRAYRAIPSSIRQGSAYERSRREAAESESWDGETTTRYQIAAIRDSLIAAQRAPYYAKRFAEAGVKAESFESLEQLAAYPMLTKEDIIRHRNEMVSGEASQRLAMTTGGSSGVPVSFFLHKGVSRAKEQAYLEATWARVGYQLGDRVAVIRGGVTSSRSDGRISSFDATRNWLALSSYHLTPERLLEYVAELNRFRPQHLHAYPSAALMLMQMGVKLDFKLTSVLCGSEKLSTEAEKQLEGHFGAPVMHWYGHSERAVLAAQRPGSSALHFWPAYGFVEFGEADAAGNREIIATSFHNHVMPLIRYRTGDLWSSESQVIGRDYEFIISRTGRRISLTAMNMHDDIFDGLLAVQFHQHELGVLECHLLPTPRWSRDREEAIKIGLLRRLGDDFDLTLHVVDQIEKTSAGKHRWLVTTLKP